MRGVGAEARGLLEAPLEPLQHVVDQVDQLLELPIRPHGGDAPVQPIRRHAGRRPGDGLHRPQGQRAQQPARRRDEQEPGHHGQQHGVAEGPQLGLEPRQVHADAQRNLLVGEGEEAPGASGRTERGVFGTEHVHRLRRLAPRRRIVKRPAAILRVVLRRRVGRQVGGRGLRQRIDPEVGRPAGRLVDGRPVGTGRADQELPADLLAIDAAQRLVEAPPVVLGLRLPDLRIDQRTELALHARAAGPLQQPAGVAAEAGQQQTGEQHAEEPDLEAERAQHHASPDLRKR